MEVVHPKKHGMFLESEISPQVLSLARFGQKAYYRRMIGVGDWHVCGQQLVLLVSHSTPYAVL